MSVRNERVEILDFEDVGADPTQEGEVVRNGGDLKGFFGGTVKSLFSGDDPFSLFNAINESHELLYSENSDGLFTGILAHVPGDPAQKIRELDNLSCDADGLINGARVRQYGSDRTTVIETLTLSGQVWTKS